ncbi:ABC transporter ATP-binding protein [Facklamia miroungae]|uniref:Multiple sugar transport system ATP-binding protein n=1 Tax=Facklamia miroungae TaxID=120956 RepID=A0A1G7V376_9LACT|nr:ABC transporter ATP-binding protein [Facklamia miroungae]NKZ30237.1 ABC transporter ATP-binding protein [Facklamia miroungae]SDG54018.1 multiple sugar transport system ATP-binding protein [Facklamia miroungae]
MQVRFEDVTMQFDDKVVLDKINFTLPDQQLISFLGPSGCGKSTTLYLISGLLSATSGKIFFGENEVTKLDPVKRGVGLVFQNYALYPHLTVKENIMFPLRMAKMKKNKRIERAEEMAALTRISDQLDKYPRQLSGGQQQRVAISRALAKQPSILLMDEPLSNLDARLRIEMREEIRRIQQATGVTTVFVTHDQEEALSIADKVMVLHNGSIQQMSDSISLYQEPNNLFVAKFIGSPVINTIQRDFEELNPSHALLKEAWETIGIRSEDILLGDKTDYLIQATVERVDQIGKDVTVHFRAGDQKIVASDIDSSLTVGSTAYLRAEMSKILAFDAQGDRLLNLVGDNNE